MSIRFSKGAAPGQPVLVTLATDTTTGDITAHWLDKTFPVEMRKEGDGRLGYVLIGVPLEAKESQLPLIVRITDGKTASEYVRNVQLKQKKYPEQRLTVSKKYVELAQKDLDRHYKEKAHVKEALAAMSLPRRWITTFLRPVPGEVSSQYGLKRFFNDAPRKPHKGIDLRGAAGTPIKACAGGTVLLAENHFFAGNSVYIDHGQGVVSMYFHMSSFAVKQGDIVTRGQVIGNVGKTGRVTGPHLHFGLSVQGVMIDPLPLLHDE